jgi:hypothetical protein
MTTTTILRAMIETVGAIVLVGIGVFLGFMTAKAGKKTPPNFTPRCQCDHVYSLHEKGYKCQSDNFVRRNYYTERHACQCTIYVGPDPLISGLWSPPVE